MNRAQPRAGALGYETPVEFEANIPPLDGTHPPRDQRSTTPFWPLALATAHR